MIRTIRGWPVFNPTRRFYFESVELFLRTSPPRVSLKLLDAREPYRVQLDVSIPPGVVDFVDIIEGVLKPRKAATPWSRILRVIRLSGAVIERTKLTGPR